MTPNPFLGTLFHALGGFAAASFYLPFKKVRQWSWETYWVVGGVQLWIICPLIVALVTVPSLLTVYQQSSWGILALTFFLGVGWGVGHLTFGLSLRYLGLSLGMGLTLGLITFFGTLLPPLFGGTLPQLLEVTAGRFALGGLLVCMVGVFFCTWAGISKERELSDEAKKETIQEFNFSKGVAVALFSGLMSSCFALAVQEGDSIQKLARDHGAQVLYANNAPFLLILMGGGLANIAACLVLNLRNRTGGNYTDRKAPLLINYLFCTAAGVIAYVEFFFYGMGESQMGEYSFSSWPIHMAFIIVLSNVWGLLLHEWRGTSKWTRFLLLLGLLALVASTLVTAYGSYLDTKT